ncbi:hypothetical protein [Ichthyenterobacterium magnum]|uniref:Lipoprotein n=1 Tax=Ichthyenterobacterium magnum TaxID=1230530 RepID=A0A420DXM8_9FLAO|nr:hypothetical protein [Ichthyenterobacterium magnum]RKE98969.1 hypothetical protein BXY80_1067 [Ichthyenterobacterium magnum]
MMRFVKLIYIVFCFFVLNCNNSSSNNQTQEVETTVDENQISQKDIENLKYVDIGLSNASKKAVSNWQKFQELSNHIDFLKQGDLSFVKSEITLVDVFFAELKTQIPKSINTNAIASRLTVLETKFYKANDLLLIDNISKKEKLKGIKELLIAVSNLNLQIDKKFELETNNVKRPN